MRTVPGQGAVITPIFNELLGVDSIIVESGGNSYDSNNPPKLRITNCGIPTETATLKPIIKDGKIIRVDVINPGYGYDPLRVQINGSNPSGLGEVDPYGAQGKVFVKRDLEGNPTGEIEYIQLTSQGDSYFGNTSATIRGGGGSQAQVVPITGFVTGLSVTNPGREYLSNNSTIRISGGGGNGAQAVPSIDEFGTVTEISVSNPGEFYETDPLILLLGGGGSGAKAKATVNLGELSNIQILDPGAKYRTAPDVILTRQSNLIRKVRNRQIYNSSVANVVGLIKNVEPSDSSILVESTSAFPGSGSIFLNKEIINYTGKTSNSFTGCNRGVNFRYDQKIILDNGSDDIFGISRYKFSVSDRVNRLLPNASNKIAKVYDWDPASKSLYIIFEIDALAFIDAGRSTEKSNVIAFIGGISGSATTEPHRVINPSSGDFITLLTSPITIYQDVKFQDTYIGQVSSTSVLFPSGDGFADIYNDDTAFENETYLNGGNAGSLYGIEDNTGGVNTTLFETGEVIRDSSTPPLEPSIVEALSLTDGERHIAITKLSITPINSISWVPTETAVGQTTGISSTVIYSRILQNGYWSTSAEMQNGSRFITVDSTIDLQPGMLIVGDVIRPKTIITKIINDTSLEISNTINGIIGNTTRSIIISQEIEPSELSDDQYYIETKNYLYVKSPVLPSGEYEYEILENIIGANNAQAKIKNIEYFQLVRNETL